VTLGVSGSGDVSVPGRRVATHVTHDGLAGALVEVACNTTWACEQEAVSQFAAEAARQLAEDPNALEAREFEARRLELCRWIGENIQINRTARFAGDTH